MFVIILRLKSVTTISGYVSTPQFGTISSCYTSEILMTLLLPHYYCIGPSFQTNLPSVIQGNQGRVVIIVHFCTPMFNAPHVPNFMVTSILETMNAFKRISEVFLGCSNFLQKSDQAPIFIDSHWAEKFSNFKFVHAKSAFHILGQNVLHQFCLCIQLQEYLDVQPQFWKNHRRNECINYARRHGG